MKTIITDGKIVTKDQVLSGYEIVIEDGIIAEIRKQKTVRPQGAEEKIYSAAGNYILPGLIDIHSDMIEGFIQPRSTAVMDFEMGFAEAERVLAMCGITTMYHSISMFRDGTWDVKEIRKSPQVRKLARLIAKYKTAPHMLRHCYHLRYEIDNAACYQDVKEMLEEGYVDLISFMDHSPGQGQYKNLDVYKKHLPNQGRELSEEQFDKLIEQEMAKDTVSFEKLKFLADMAKEKGIAVASHDDDTIDKLKINQELGVTISEFPITLEVAKEAASNGFTTVLGAPNILLGGSHSGNLSALQAIQEDCAGVLVSDYYPQALLQAVFYLYHDCGLPLPKAAAYVSLNPAKAVGLSDITGSIEEGKQADIIIVSGEGKYPVIQSVFAGGTCVVSTQYQQYGM